LSIGLHNAEGYVVFQIGITHLVVYINKADAADTEMLELVSFIVFFNTSITFWRVFTIIDENKRIFYVYSFFIGNL